MKNSRKKREKEGLKININAFGRAA